MILRLFFIAFSFALASNEKGFRTTDTTAEENRDLNIGCPPAGLPEEQKTCPAAVAT